MRFYCANPSRWTYGGWLRLDGTPPDDLGSSAANRTTLGSWEVRWHGLEHYWDSYIADMDRTKQQTSVYEPIRRSAAGNFSLSGLVSPSAWCAFFAGLWADLARTLGSGIMGKLARARSC